VLVSDYGRGVTSHAGVREALKRAAARAPMVWDPHPLGAVPVPGCLVATPNHDEAARVAGEPSSERPTAGGLPDVARASTRLLERWPVRSVAVTMGAAGALLASAAGPPLVVPAPAVPTGDVCGAGDRFAAAATAALARGAVLSEAVQTAVASASQFVAAGGAAAVGLHVPRAQPARNGAARSDGCEGHAAPEPIVPQAWLDAFRRVETARAAGATVVATGGCFDLLHAGHVDLLAKARSLGDLLVVCLNADASVGRLKGDGRPVVAEGDRRRVLEALASVDAVAVFEEDTPEELLRALRPDLFVKGGDYAASTLPEEEVMSGWDGQVVLVPYLSGRSTTGLLAQAGDALNTSTTLAASKGAR